MTTELYWLALTLLMTSLFALPYFIDRIIVRGPARAMSGELAATTDQSGWAQRAIAAHRNATENLVVFAPAVLVLAVLHISTPMTRAAAMVYFVARAAHYVIYITGVPVLRTLAYSAGLAATIVLILAALRWM